MNNGKTKLITVRINNDALEKIEETGKELDRSRNYLINKALVEKFLSHSLVSNQ